MVATRRRSARGAEAPQIALQIVDGADCRTDVEHQGLLSGSVAEIGIERGDESILEVARKAGMSHQAPYYYFGDRGRSWLPLPAQTSRNLGRRLCTPSLKRARNRSSP